MAEKSSRSASSTSTTTTNVGKLYRLLVDGGTKAVKIQLEKHFKPFPSKLVNFLKTNPDEIQKLVESKVLNSDQLKQLHPDDGSDPDPEKFDIGLIILILTNFCKLHPPRAGWSNMPQEKDRSLSAKLVRLRLFRNKLLHRSNTRFKEKEFLDLWKKLEGILCSLGLCSSDIEKFWRLEDCEEKYYFEVLKKWADSEEDSNRRFKAIYDNQIKVQKIAQDTKQAVVRVEQKQIEDGKLLRVDHRNIQDTKQTVVDTKQAVVRVEQNQMEDGKLLREDHTNIQDTKQAVVDTKQAVLRVEQNQMEGGKLLREDHTNIQDTKQAVLRVEQNQMQLRCEAAKADERKEKEKEDKALRELVELNPKSDIELHSRKYQEGTRLSIVDKIESKLNEHRVLVITGDAGMGKSVIAAVICKEMNKAGRLLGSHFFHHDSEQYGNPKNMLLSLALQLCDALDEYKSEIVKKLNRNLGANNINDLKVKDLFKLLFEEPLSSVGDPGRNRLIVIDGLDEIQGQGRDELLDVVANHFCTLPSWVRFCVTARPEENITDKLNKFDPIHLKQDDEDNVKDISHFVRRQLSGVIHSGLAEVVIGELTLKAEGHFLFASLMVDFIKKNVSRVPLEELVRNLPTDVSGYYKSYFQRLREEFKSIKELTITDVQFLTFLGVLVAKREPLPLGFASKLLVLDTESPAVHQHVRKVNDCISTLLPIKDGCVDFFHKSVKDWLTERAPDKYGVPHEFYVNENWGHRDLSELCIAELHDVKRTRVHGTDFSDATKYALRHGVDHMLAEESPRVSNNFEEIVKNYVINLKIVYAKSCVHHTVNSEDIIRVQEREAFNSLSDESQRALSTLFSLVRKYRRRLSTHPSTIFQVMVNEGGDVFAGEATKVLQSLEIPYMEYLHKEAVKKESQKTQAEFPFPSKLACFDISPTQEFMVCECTDEMIYFWSLKTGEQRWVRPAGFKKWYSEPFCHFRVVPNSNVFSCYRSVVFHPTEPIVLPGILSHAYSFQGNLQPLFPKSNCRFSVCSVHGDESKIITDCPGDAKCLVMWNLKNGEEITRTIRNEDVLSFAWSPDGTLLAISHFSGLVCLVDALNCLDTTLAEVAINQPCGMIKFTPDIQFLFCLSWPIPPSKDKRNELQTLSFPLNVIKLPCGTFSLNVLDNAFADDPWNFKSSSKGGFLMGDPMLYRSSSENYLFDLFSFAFVLNKQSVLQVSHGNRTITMLKLEDYLRATWFSRSCCILGIAFALDGKTIFFTIKWVKSLQVVAVDVSSGDRKAEKVIRTHDVLLVPVSEGVLLKQSEPGADVQLWNFELSQQIRSWPNLSEVRDIMPVSDHCVACVGRDFEVSILDTSNGNIVKTIPLCHEGFQSTHRLLYRKAIEKTIVCNSKYQLLSTARYSVQLSDGKNELWKRTLKFPHFFPLDLPGMFSPTEEFVLVSSTKSKSKKEELLVLEASSGKNLRTLCTVDSILRCAFVSKTECVIFCENTSGSYCLQLFSVSTGDFLTVLDIDFEPSRCLASCPQKGLIAIGIENSKCSMCAVIQVKQLRDKVNREAKGEQCVFFLSLVEELLSLRSVDRSHRPTLNWQY